VERDGAAGEAVGIHVADRHHADHVGVRIDHGKMADPPAAHEFGEVVHGRVGGAADDIPRHHGGHERVPGRKRLGDHPAEDVAFREDADKTAALEHEQRPDPVPVHEVRRLEHRHVGRRRDERRGLRVQKIERGIHGRFSPECIRIIPCQSPVKLYAGTRPRSQTEAGSGGEDQRISRRFARKSTRHAARRLHRHAPRGASDVFSLPRHLKAGLVNVIYPTYQAAEWFGRRDRWVSSTDRRSGAFEKSLFDLPCSFLFLRRFA